MPAPLRLRLEQELREAVAERYEQAHTPLERTNCQMVLLADDVDQVLRNLISDGVVASERSGKSEVVVYRG